MCYQYIGLDTSVRKQPRPSWKRSLHLSFYSSVATTDLFLFARVNEPDTIATAVLAIERVSSRHFRSEFTCHGNGLYKTANKTVTLKQRGQCRVTASYQWLRFSSYSFSFSLLFLPLHPQLRLNYPPRGWRSVGVSVFGGCTCTGQVLRRRPRSAVQTLRLKDKWQAG